MKWPTQDRQAHLWSILQLDFNMKDTCFRHSAMKITNFDEVAITESPYGLIYQTSDEIAKNCCWTQGNSRTDDYFKKGQDISFGFMFEI